MYFILNLQKFHIKNFAVCALNLYLILPLQLPKEVGFFHYSKLFWHYGSKLNFSENGVGKILKRAPRLPQRKCPPTQGLGTRYSRNLLVPKQTIKLVCVVTFNSGEKSKKKKGGNSSLNFYIYYIKVLNFFQIFKWYFRRDSNPEQTGYKPGALTIELRKHKRIILSQENP